jgi:hypothetical protein
MPDNKLKPTDWFYIVSESDGTCANGDPADTSQPVCRVANVKTAQRICRAVNDRDDLLAALKAIEPQIGWRSHAGEDPEQYYCEFCRAHAEDYSHTVHKENCHVTAVRAAIAKAEGR